MLPLPTSMALPPEPTHAGLGHPNRLLPAPKFLILELTPADCWETAPVAKTGKPDGTFTWGMDLAPIEERVVHIPHDYVNELVPWKIWQLESDSVDRELMTAGKAAREFTATEIITKAREAQPRLQSYQRQMIDMITNARDKLDAQNVPQDWKVDEQFALVIRDRRFNGEELCDLSDDDLNHRSKIGFYPLFEQRAIRFERDRRNTTAKCGAELKPVKFFTDLELDDALGSCRPIQQHSFVMRILRREQQYRQALRALTQQASTPRLERADGRGTGIRSQLVGHRYDMLVFDEKSEIGNRQCVVPFPPHE